MAKKVEKSTKPEKVVKAKAEPKAKKTSKVEEKKINKGNTVIVNYTGKLTSGQVFDTSEGRAPLKFEVGANQVIPAFESSIIGKSMGFKTTLSINSDNAYGSVKPELIVRVPLDKVPQGVQVGQTLNAVANEQQIAVRVIEVSNDHVVVDGNHPLAGKDLIFDIEIVDVL